MSVEWGRVGGAIPWRVGGMDSRHTCRWGGRMEVGRGGEGGGSAEGGWRGEQVWGVQGWMDGWGGGGGGRKWVSGLVSGWVGYVGGWESGPSKMPGRAPT